MPRRPKQTDEERPLFSDKSEWAQALDDTNQLRKRTPWQMARLVLWGLQNYCTTKDEISDLYDEVSEQLEVSRKTLQNYASVARRFSDEQIRERLDIGHHIAVVAMPDELIDYWLSRAEANAWSVGKLRQEIRASSQTPQEDEEDPQSELNIALQRLAHQGISAIGDEKLVSMKFTDGSVVNVSSSSNLHWSVA